jgi:hypothetical protein
MRMLQVFFREQPQLVLLPFRKFPAKAKDSFPQSHVQAYTF